RGNSRSVPMGGVVDQVRALVEAGHAEIVLTGVDLTVTQVETSPVTLAVTPDSAAVAKLGSNLVGQLNLVLNEIKSQTAATTTTNADGTTSVSGGVLSGDSTVRGLADSLSEAGSYDIDNVSPSTIGINVDKDGVFSFDATAFGAALAADPAKVQSMLTAIANRVAAVATTASDKYDGTLTSSITSDNQQLTDLGNKIANWTSVLADRKAALEAQWATLETSLSKLKDQSNYLTSALSALSGSSSSSSSR
ncbi:MAG: flagellar filament capping protein FliD, partial [Cellulomonas sp.]|nr:flagellar filament capping protein FliD [Cellulomonas sp.]